MADEYQLVPESSAFALYQPNDGTGAVRVRIEGETVWLTQAQMAELFQTTPQNITIHIKTIYEDGEQSETATCKDYLQVRTEGGRRVERALKHYNLDAILAVGFRVRSLRGTQFRQWATATLSEYLVKGFAMDDERLKEGRNLGTDYFDELLARIRDIRSSERMFWQKVLDIYATSIDYDGAAEASQLFFKTVQNKVHWAAHGHTAAEVIAARVDASKPNMGLTAWKNAPAGPVRKGDVSIAKNYLDADEIDALNRIVNAYLEFAELQAKGRKPMHMADWIAKLDDFIRLSDRELLTHAGQVSHETAKLKAEAEYEAFHAEQAALPQPVDEHFGDAIEELKRLEAQAKKKPSRGRKEKGGGV